MPTKMPKAGFLNIENGTTVGLGTFLGHAITAHSIYILNRVGRGGGIVLAPRKERKGGKVNFK